MLLAARDGIVINHKWCWFAWDLGFYGDGWDGLSEKAK
jgi:hypothetical protein